MESFENTVEFYFTKNAEKTNIVYKIIIFLIFAILISLPFIYVNITVQGTGILRPVSEKTEVKSLISGMVNKVFVTEGQRVVKDEILLQLRSDILESKIKLLEFQCKKNLELIADLENLLAGKTSNFLTPMYQQDFIEYRKKINDIETRRIKAAREMERNKPLFQNGIIPEKDFDDIKFQLQLIENELSTTKEIQISRWQSQILQYKNEWELNNSQLSQALENKKLYIISSPISGTIETFSGIYAGTNLQEGQTIAVISPGASISAEVYISPRDIGLLNSSNEVNVLVDAFNYTEWGIVKAKIYEISSDYHMINNIPMFRVRCNLEKNYLQLSNGLRGFLKKGMTIKARFIVTERSLFQLIFDKANDWFNPSMNQKNMIIK